MAAASGIRAGKAFVEIGAKLDPLQKGLREAQAQLKAFGAGVRAIGLGVSAAATAALAPIAASVVSFARTGDALDEASSRTGASVEALSELGFAAGLSGASMEDLEAGLRILQRTTVKAADGSDAAAAALAKVGVSAAGLLALKPEDQLAAVAEGLSKIDNPAERAAAAMALLGRGGTKLLPLLERGAAGLAEFRKTAQDFGITISTQDAKAAAKFSDAFDTLRAVTVRAGDAIGAALAPVVTDLANTLVNVVVGVSKFIQENRGLVVSVAAVSSGLLAVGGALIGVGLTITVVSITLGGLASAITAVVAVAGVASAVFTSMILPLGLLAGIAAAGGGAFVAFADSGGASLQALREDAVAAFGGIASALADGDIASAADVLWSGLKTAWTNGTSELAKLWEGWIATIKKGMVVIETTIRDVFDRVTTYVAKAINAITSTTTQLVGAGKALLGGDVSGGVAQIVSADFAGAQSSKQLDSDLGERAAAREGELGARLAKIEEEKLAALKSIDASREEGRQVLRDALSRAGQAKIQRDAERTGPPVPADLGGDSSAARVRALEAELDARRADAALRPEARGTFSSDVASLQSGVTADRERALRIQEEIRALVKKIAERVQSGDSLVFEE